MFQEIDFWVDVPELVKALNLTGMKNDELSKQGFQYALTTDGTNNPFYLKFKYDTASDAYADIPFRENDVEILPILSGTYAEELKNMMDMYIALKGLRPGRMYLSWLDKTRVTPFRASLGMTFFIINLTTHNKSMLLTRELCHVLEEKGKVYEFNPDGVFSHYNGHMTERSAILVIEAHEIN